MGNRTSLGYVIDQLRQEGYVTDERTIDRALFTGQSNSPWYIQGLVGFGGWIAAIFMLGIISSFISLFLSGMNETGVGIFLLFGGSIFVGGTSIAARNDDFGVFVTQVLLTIHIAGHALLIAGFMLAFQLYQTEMQTIILAIYTIILQVVFIVLYPNAIYRFLAMLLISYCLAWIAFIYELPILVSIVTGALMLLGIIIWADKLSNDWQIQYMPVLEPIAYGAIVGAFGLIIYEVSNRYIYYEQVPADTAYITTAILFVFLIWLEIQLLREYNLPLIAPFAFTMFGISALVSIPIYATPGILAAIIGILLAFRRRNWVLLGISYLYLAGFIVYYYYWLEVSLLTKSIILIVTGIVLIAGRLFLRRIVIIPHQSEGLDA